MNKKYKFDSEGNLVVVTDNGEAIEREDKYTANTEQILSLENVIESLEKKKDYFKDELDILSTRRNDNIKNIVMYTIVSSLVISFLTFIYSMLSIAVFLIFISTFTLSFISTLIPDILILINDNKEIKKYTKKINIESHKIEKIKKKIEFLSKKQKVIKQKTDNRILLDKIDKYIDIKSMSNYYDTNEYFIMNYLIDTNSRRENLNNKKVRKLLKNDKHIYKF